MDTKNRTKIASGIISGAMLSIVFIAVVTPVADLLPALKNALKETFGHHWVGKSILAALLFGVGSVVCPALSSTTSEETIWRKLNQLILITIAGAAVITLFFIWEALWRS